MKRPDKSTVFVLVLAIISAPFVYLLREYLMDPLYVLIYFVISLLMALVIFRKRSIRYRLLMVPLFFLIVNVLFIVLLSVAIIITFKFWPPESPFIL